MISASEAAAREVDPAVAARGMNPSGAGGTIKPLHFEKIDHPLRRRTDWMLNEDEESYTAAGRLKDELDAAKSRLNAGTQQLPAQLAAARNEGRLEAKREFDAELEQLMQAERKQVADVCAAFTESRTSYFAAVEGEVVHLALGIAARVLHREAKLDPLLLSAVVRLALEKVEEDSAAVLHVPVKDAEAWRAMLAAEHLTSVRVIGEDRMSSIDCRLETTVGKVELGVCAQLDEIEKGFFDLMQQRPA